MDKGSDDEKPILAEDLVSVMNSVMNRHYKLGALRDQAEIDFQQSKLEVDSLKLSMALAKAQLEMKIALQKLKPD